MGFHRGRLQVIPPTYTLPRMTYKKLIDIWYVGSKRYIDPTVRTFERIACGTLGNSRKSEFWESEAETDEMCDGNLG